MMLCPWPGVAGANMKWPHGSHGFELSSNVISKFSGRLMIGQNDSLDVLLLEDVFLQFKRVEMT